MKNLIAFLQLIALVMAQRPTYAGSSSKGYPELHSRFRDPAEDNQTSTDANVGIANRVGVANRVGDEQPPPQNLPTDARGDSLLVNRLNQWPRENRPFWLLNSQQIEKHRHPEDTNQLNQQDFNQNRQTFTDNQQSSLTEERQQIPDGFQPVNGNQQATGLQSRFGESVGSETKTIKPLTQRGSFSGPRS